MGDLLTVQAVVLSVMPIGEYDKRVVLLTRERGKITAFAKGARRARSPLLAAANPFVFGSFSLYEGRNSYHLAQAAVRHQFLELSGVQPGIYYGFYFLEVADYFGREYTDEREMMNLLYVTFQALLHQRLSPELIRAVFELRTLTIQGECPVLDRCALCGEGEALTAFSAEACGLVCRKCRRQAGRYKEVSPAALHALRYAAFSPLGRLYGFSLAPEAEREAVFLVSDYFRKNTDKRFRSLEILEQLGEIPGNFH